MAVRRVFTGRAYGLRNPLQKEAPTPIVANRAPTLNDNAPLGTNWLDQVGEDAYIAVKTGPTGTIWATAPASSATIVTSLTVTGAGGITVDIGDIDVTLGSVDIAAGDLDVAGTTTVNDLVIQGDVDLTSAALIDLTSTLDAAPSIYLHANGGTAEQILLRSDQGTAVDSVSLLSDVGGITLRATGLASADAINLEAASGGIDMDAALQINIATSQNAANAMVLTSSAGGIDITAAGAAGEDIDVVCTAGSVNLTSGEVIANSMVLTSAGGLDMTVAGTGALDIDIVNTSGSINITAGQSAADSIVITSSIGGIDILAAGAAAGEDIDIIATGSSINLQATEAVASAITINASDATGGIIVSAGTNGFGATATDGNVTLATVSTGSVVVSSAAAFTVGAATTSVVTVTGAAADLTLTSVGGSVNVLASEAAANAVRIQASDVAGGIDVDAGTGGVIVDTTGAISLDAAAASNFTATGAFDVTVSSTAGSVIVSGGEAVIDAVQLTAAAGGVQVTTAALGATTGLNLVQGAVNASIQVGSGDPVHSAPKGSLYIKTDATTTVTRLWVNTDAGTTWAFFTASA